MQVTLYKWKGRFNGACRPVDSMERGRLVFDSGIVLTFAREGMVNSRRQWSDRRRCLGKNTSGAVGGRSFGSDLESRQTGL